MPREKGDSQPQTLSSLSGETFNLFRESICQEFQHERWFEKTYKTQCPFRHKHILTGLPNLMYTLKFFAAAIALFAVQAQATPGYGPTPCESCNPFQLTILLCTKLSFKVVTMYTARVKNNAARQ